MWQEKGDLKSFRKRKKRRWLIEHDKDTQYRDSLGRIIYFKTRDAAYRKACELNRAAEAISYNASTYGASFPMW